MPIPQGQNESQLTREQLPNRQKQLTVDNPRDKNS